jgi:hypothetical protein
MRYPNSRRNLFNDIDVDNVEKLSTKIVDNLRIVLIYPDNGDGVDNVEKLSTKIVDNSLLSSGYPHYFLRRCG